MRCAALLLVLAACSGGSTDGMDAAGQDGDAGASKLCDPGLDGPVWSIEGDPVSFRVGCREAYELGDRAITLMEAPSGATYDPDTRVFEWTPGLDQAAVYDLVFEVPHLDGETGTVTVGVADRWDHPDNVPVTDPTRYPMELGLPVLFIDEPPTDKEWAQITAHYRGRELVGEAKLRGKSSLGYPKNSYALRFDSANALSETELADFSDKRRLVATTTFDDNSYVRQRLCYWLWSQMEPTIAIETFSAVVYLRGEYHGLYTIGDHPNARLMQESGLADSGNLYKAETHDANFRLTSHEGPDKATLHDGYSKTEGEPEEGEPGAFADLEALVDFVATSDDDAFAADIANRIHAREYSDWFILVHFALARDSGGKNSYHYHDATHTWRVAPWDFNESLGQTWQTQRASSDEIFDFEDRNLLFTRLRNHPTLGPELAARYAELLAAGGPLSSSGIDARFEAMVAETEAGALRDWTKWQEAYRDHPGWSERTDFTSYAEEVAYVRSWIQERRAVIDDLY